MLYFESYSAESPSLVLFQTLYVLISLLVGRRALTYIDTLQLFEIEKNRILSVSETTMIQT